jgi:hypothetical protein
MEKVKRCSAFPLLIGNAKASVWEIVRKCGFEWIYEFIRTYPNPSINFYELLRIVLKRVYILFLIRHLTF